MKCRNHKAVYECAVLEGVVGLDKNMIFSIFYENVVVMKLLFQHLLIY